MGKFMQDFKAFVAKGNVIDMAVGVVIGKAFNDIVNSLVADIIMPLISLIGGKDISQWKLILKNKGTPDEIAVKYGNFIQKGVDFFIIAMSIFVVLRVFTKLQRQRAKEEAK